MKKITALLFLFVFVFTSCNKDFDTINDNIKQASAVPAETLFSEAQRNLVDALTTPNVNSNIFRLLSQQWAETTYPDESQYDLITRTIPDNFWQGMYRDVLANFNEAERLLKADKSVPNPANPNKVKNQLAITEIMIVYSYSILVNTFGNIPYSEALDVNNITPKYDDAATIYTDLFKRLDAAISSLDAGSTSFGSADFFYTGNIAQWKKFANSLKLRMAMTLSDVNPAQAKAAAEQAAPGVFASNADNAIFKYLTTPPNTNPIWVNLIQSGRIDFVASNTIISIVKPLNDPRLPFFFNKNKAGDYSGGVYGNSNSYVNYSLPSDQITATDYPADLLDDAEVEFYLAEAVERGFAVGGTAEDHYNKAIKASIAFWGGSDADASTYLAQPSVAYSTATGTYKQKIGTQKWIALYNRGFEAWTEQRRLDYPVLNVVAKPKADFPNRFTYPVREQNLNVAQYTAGAQAVGGDKPGTKLFWDKF